MHVLKKKSFSKEYYLTIIHRVLIENIFLSVDDIKKKFFFLRIIYIICLQYL